MADELREQLQSELSTESVRIATGPELDFGSLAIEIKNGLIKDYTVDGRTESWQVVNFDGVHRTKITHKIGTA